MSSDHPHITDIFFDNLFREYYKSLRAYAYRYIGNYQAAEDVVQDVFFQLWEKREQLDQIGSIRSYLFSSVYNRSINYLKHKKIQVDYHLKQSATKTRLETYYRSHIESNRESLLAKELEQQISDCIRIMPDQCRKVFILSRKYGLKNAEIADQLGVSLKTIEKHISKGLALLRKHLKDYLPVILAAVLFFLSQR